MKVLGFSPVYNQVHELPTLLGELEETHPPCDDFLLVNNGSADGSEELIERSGLPSIAAPQNRGVGWAIMAATEWAAENGYEVLVGLASNGKMLPSEMGRVIEPILSGESDYVTRESIPRRRCFTELAWVPATCDPCRQRAGEAGNRAGDYGRHVRVSGVPRRHLRAGAVRLAGRVAVDLCLGAVRVRQGAVLAR
ncbi:MAG: hypothetical protein GKS06_04205 [Acidobacteria bacterium]|nr:hypothetical protein [Acidobacteriota bacterium]